MAPGDRGDFRARLLWAINNIEERANVTQFETNFKSVTNEGQTPNVGLAIPMDDASTQTFMAAHICFENASLRLPL
jgi:hypothetical protein